MLTFALKNIGESNARS